MNSGLSLYESPNSQFVTFVMYIINVSEHEKPELSILSCIWEVVILNCDASMFVIEVFLFFQPGEGIGL